jgi:hypothetical protein
MADKEELAELARLNAFAKGYRSTFVLIRNRLTQALPLYRDGPTLSPQRTIDDGLNKLGMQLTRSTSPTSASSNSTQTSVIRPTTRNTRTSLALSTTTSALGQTLLGHMKGRQVQQQLLAQADIVAATLAAMQAANGQAGPKKIDYNLKLKILGKEFITSELRILSKQMRYFWDPQLMDARVEKVQWGNFFNCMHMSLKTYYKPKMPRGIGICNARNAGDPQANHRTALPIMQKDHQTTWPIHNRRVNLLGKEQKEEQSFDMWQVSLYTLGEDANVDWLTGRD